MKTVTLVLRILLGAGMLFFGLNKFFHWFDPSAGEPPPEAMQTWFAGMMATEYLLPLVAIVEIVTGILFLVNKFVPLALVILLPVMLNAMLVHAFMDPKHIVGAAVFLFINIFLMYQHKSAYKELLKP